MAEQSRRDMTALDDSWQGRVSGAPSSRGLLDKLMHEQN